MIFNRFRVLVTFCPQINAEDFSRVGRALTFTRLPGTHSFESIASCLNEAREKFKIPEEKIVATTTDNGKITIRLRMIRTNRFLGNDLFSFISKTQYMSLIQGYVIVFLNLAVKNNVTA